jgi:hypothetical protein
MSNKNQTRLIGAIKLRTGILAIENICTRGNVVCCGLYKREAGVRQTKNGTGNILVKSRGLVVH